MGKKRRKKRARPKGKPVQRPGLRAPKDRLKPLFTLFSDVSKAGNEALSETTEPENPAVRFDAGILTRGLNTLASIRILLEQAHWELASAGTRQLFELLVNMEYLNSQEDWEEASLRYAKFGLLQLARQQEMEMEYAAKTGRPVDEKRKKTIQELLASPSFAEFRGKNGHWVHSWSGKNVRQLAEASERPIRTDQYKQLFSAWSEQTHASPGAILANIMPRQGEDVIGEIMASDDREVIQVAGMALTLFFELWWQLSNVVALDHGKAAAWMERFAEEAQKHGAPHSLDLEHL